MTICANLTVIANRYTAHLLHLFLLNPHHSPLLNRVRVLHAHILTSGFKPRRNILNRLLELYTKADDLASARRLFDECPHMDIVGRTTLISSYFRSGDHKTARMIFDMTPLCVRSTRSYNSMISGYSRADEGGRAVEVYREMLRESFHPDDYTLTSLLSSARAIAGVDVGRCRQLHCAVVKYGTEDVMSVSNALIALYAHCGSSEGICCAGEVFNKMPVRNKMTWTSMITAHAKLGDVGAARDLFDGMTETERVGVIWNAMISGYVQNGCFLEASGLFRDMQSNGVPLDEYTYTSVLTLCGSSGLYKIGKSVHGHIVRAVPDFDQESALHVKNALVTLHSKCGNVDNAWRVFVKISDKDVVSWNAMIAAFAQHGRGLEAVELFEEMLLKNIPPNSVTFLKILAACNHAGLVDEGLRYFDHMKYDCQMIPEEDHYAQLIELLGRAGRLAEAKEVITMMPSQPGPQIWKAILAACRIHRNLELGLHAAEQVYEMSPQHGGTYVLLSDMYASFKMWDGVAMVRKLMMDGLVKR